MAGNGQKMDCNKCAHYYVTWDTHFPKGCRALGFKSRKDPSRVVFESSGMDCQLFTPKVGGDKGGRGDKSGAGAGGGSRPA
jgi:hypothetical protein